MLVVCISLGGVFLFYQVNTSSHLLSEKERQDSMKKNLGRGIKTEDTSAGTIHTFTGKKYSFSYPGNFSPYTVDQDKATRNPAVFDFFIIQNRTTHVFFSTEADDAANFHSYTDIPSVMLRRNRKEVYSESQLIISGQPAVLFTKKDDGAEQSVFLLSHKVLYSFVATSPNMLSITEQMEKILPTIHIN